MYNRYLDHTGFDDMFVPVNEAPPKPPPPPPPRPPEPGIRGGFLDLIFNKVKTIELDLDTILLIIIIIFLLTDKNKENDWIVILIAVGLVLFF